MLPAALFHRRRQAHIPFVHRLKSELLFFPHPSYAGFPAKFVFLRIVNQSPVRLPFRRRRLLYLRFPLRMPHAEHLLLQSIPRLTSLQMQAPAMHRLQAKPYPLQILYVWKAFLCAYRRYPYKANRRESKNRCVPFLLRRQTALQLLDCRRTNG